MRVITTSQCTFIAMEKAHLGIQRFDSGNVVLGAQDGYYSGGGVVRLMGFHKNGL